jgi:hypothetical protein
MATKHEFEVQDTRGAPVRGELTVSEATGETVMRLKGHHGRELSLKEAKNLANDILGLIRREEAAQKYRPIKGQEAAF